MKHFVIKSLMLLWLLASALAVRGQEPFDVLVFSKTNDYRHESIEAGQKAIARMAHDNGFSVLFSEDSLAFRPAILDTVEVVIFLNTSGNVLGTEGKESLERFVQNGGGFVGVHCATATEYQWEWYGALLGCYFEDHPEIQEATVQVTDPAHRSTRHLPLRWTRTDEWYNFDNLPPGHMNVLLTLDESTYTGGTMGSHHPIAWYGPWQGGQVFYTALGHTEASYQEMDLLEHLLGGILWAAGR